jgi:hypothetical protein
VSDVGPTHLVAVWLANDEPLYRQALALSGQAQRAAAGTPAASREAVFILADDLAEWVAGLVPDLSSATSSAGVIRDLVSWALANVRWPELAQQFLDDGAALERALVEPVSRD